MRCALGIATLVLAGCASGRAFEVPEHGSIVLWTEARCGVVAAQPSTALCVTRDGAGQLAYWSAELVSAAPQPKEEDAP